MHVTAEGCSVFVKKLPVGIKVHKRTGIHAKVVAEADYIYQVADRIADPLERGQMAFHKQIQQHVNVLLIDVYVHKEVVHPAQKCAPLKKVAAAYNQRNNFV